MPKETKQFNVIIDGDVFSFNDPKVTGNQLLTVAKKYPVDEHIIFQHLNDGQFEEIRLEETVDLTQPGAERFKTFKSAESYRFTVDGRKFEWGAPEISGQTLKRFGEVEPSTFDVWMEIRGPGGDVLVADTDIVRLDEPGLERFYTAEVSITIIINGRPRKVNKSCLFFSEIVELAFPGSPSAPDTIYTMVYKNGPENNPQGSLIEGQTVKLKNGMIINVTKTDKS